MTLENKDLIAPGSTPKRSSNVTDMASQLEPYFQQLPLESQLMIGQLGCVPGLRAIFDARRVALQEELLNIDTTVDADLIKQYMLYRVEILFLQDMAAFFDFAGNYYRLVQTGQG